MIDFLFNEVYRVLLEGTVRGVKYSTMYVAW